MSFFSLWNWLNARQRQSKVGRRRPQRHEPTVRGRMVPRLEALEDRTVPSTLTVTNNLDTGIAGDGSLRGEMAAASSGDTINFAPSLAGQTITLTQGELAISKSLDIEGLGANQQTVSGNNQSRVFDITASNAPVTIAGLTISGGLSSDGSGITNVGTLTVNDCTLTGNVANNDIGGAIDNLGTLNVNSCTLSGNVGYFGAAIANAGTLAINNSAITGNSVVGVSEGYPTTSGYVAPAGDGCGGGIYASSGTLSINSSTIADNEAIGGSDPGGNAGTGAGGGLFIAGGTVTIDNSTFADNQAIGGTYTGSGIGGGIENHGGTVTIDNSTIAGNQATGGGYNFSFGSGGGIDNGAGTLSINNSTVADNQAKTLIVSTLGGGNGGGISGAPQMYDTILADNTASYAPDLDGSVTSLGHNLIGNTTGGSGFVASDLLNANADLGPLQNNGGPTQTMALLAGSSAVNTGDITNAPAYDQRGPGYPRIVGGFIDIGAIEVQNSSPTRASSLAVTGFSSVVTAGSAGSFKVTALNADGTTDTSYTGTVRFSSSDVQAGLPAVYTFTAADGGVHTFSATLKTAGAQSITVTDLIFGTTGTQTGINVTPGAAKLLAFARPPSTATAGQAISPAVVVDVEDAYGNLVTGDSSTVTVTLSSGTFAGGSNTASVQASGGVATFSALTIDKAGSYTLTASSSLTWSVSARFSVTSAAASKFVLTGPSSVRRGVAFSLTLTVEDAYGNVVTGYSGTVHFSSSDRATLPASYTFNPATSAVHTFTGLILRKTGNQTITITDTLDSSLTASIIVDVL
jgi:hypothetical protein